MKINIVVHDGKANNWEEAIAISAQTLFDKGYVNSEFSLACINREKEFPTGIPSGIPFAIPHAESKFVHEDSLCVLRLKDSVDFFRMDDPDSAVPVRLVINLALQKDNNQITMLRKLMEAFMNDDFINQSIQLPEQEVVQLFQKF